MKKRTNKKMGKLFEEYAKPDENGYSDAVDVVNISDEKFKSLNVTNGCSYARNNSYLNAKYHVIKNRKNGGANTKILSIKLDGFKKD